MKVRNCWWLGVIIILSVLLCSSFSSSAAQISLEYWYDGADLPTQLMRAAAEEYSKVRPDVTIVFKDPVITVERMATALAAKKGPDILWYWHNVPWFWGIESVYPLNEFVLDPEIGINPDIVIPGLRETAHYGGVVMAIPVTGFPGGIFYNRKMFQEAGLTDDDAPTTWDELVELAEKLEVRDASGRVLRWGLTPHVVDWFWQEAVLANGGDFCNEDLTEYLPDAERALESLQWVYDLVHTYEVMPIPRGVSWVGTSELLADEMAFVLEKSAMSGYLGHATHVDYLADNPDLDLGFVPSPQGPSAKEYPIGGTGVTGFFVMADTKYPREAYLFAKWFFEEKLLDFCEKTGHIPANLEALKEPWWREHVIHGRMIEFLSRMKLRNFHNFPGRLDVRKEEPAMVEKVLHKRATPEEAIRDFKRHADRVFRLWEKDLREFYKNHKIVW